MSIKLSSSGGAGDKGEDREKRVREGKVELESKKGKGYSVNCRVLLFTCGANLEGNVTK